MTRYLLVTVETYDGTYPDPGALARQAKDALTTRSVDLHAVTVFVDEITSLEQIERKP